MQKMLVAASSAEHRTLLYEIFASQYELLQTDNSRELCELLQQHKDELALALISATLAERITKEDAAALLSIHIFKAVPVLLIVPEETEPIHLPKLPIPFSDVIGCPINPTVVKKRVANLVGFFSSEKTLEQLVNDQTKKILEQNRELRDQQKKINTINNDVLDTLSMVIEYRDVESGRHIHRIRKFTEVLLQTLAEKYPKYHLTPDKIELITSASSIHDIGKIAIPDSILLAPRRLTYEEFRIMKQHTVKGCEILNQLDAVERNEYFRYCYDICRYHHEKWDGMGYPDGLVGDQIPIWAQVVSLADCYDALTSERPYKSAYSHEQAVEMIRTGACGAFSEEMMDCFSAVLPKFRDLAIRYADPSHADRNVKSPPPPAAVEKPEEHKKDIYQKMDRNDLIETVEHLKQVLADTRKGDRDVLYRLSDYAFEFDIANDMLHERKNSMKEIVGYIPKNYEEAINNLADCCEEEYRTLFIKFFRLRHLYEKLSEGEERVVLECRMDCAHAHRLPVRCAAVPLLKGDSIEKVFLTITILSGDEVNHRFDTDRDIVTGLWNYTGVKREVEEYLHDAGKNGYHALVMIDIDDFHTINRLAGYRFGNDILCDISNLLKYRLQSSNILGRIEDDNFVIFINDCPDKEQRNEIIKDIFNCVHKSYLFEEERSPDISASIGIALYPDNGGSFDELFRHAAKAVEVAKLNGKNMYLYYNPSMQDNMELKLYYTSLKVQESAELECPVFKQFFLPVVSSAGGYVLSYDVIGLDAEMLSVLTDLDHVFETAAPNGRTTALCLNHLNKLIASIYALEQENLKLPSLSLLLMFDRSDDHAVLVALEELLHKYPIHCRHIYLMIAQDTVEQFTLPELAEFIGRLKVLGFRVGVYHFGAGHIPINCLPKGMFDRIDFARELIQAIEDGIYHTELLSTLIRYLDRTGAVCVLPGGIPETFAEAMRELCPLSFGYHKEEMIPLSDFALQLKVSSSAIPEYPVLSHERTSLVLNEKMYDEILEQTRSFILEWSPRFDTIKLSGSFRYLYGYQPQEEDFFRHLNENHMIHADDKEKLMEKMNAARSDPSESEAFVRVYSQPEDDYRWNRVHFVTIKNEADIPVRIMAVFTDITDSRSEDSDDQRRDRTDFITSLYNKHATENKIKSFLYEEGASNGHAFLIAEICGFEVLERQLGTVFANAVLKETAQNIRELFRDSDIIGRSSGNRFIIFIKGLIIRPKITEKAEQINRIIGNTYQSDTGEISVCGKIGVSLFPSNGSTYDELYSSALKSLYYAKHSPVVDICFSSDLDNSTKLLHD